MLSVFQPLGVVISSGIAYGFIPSVRIFGLNLFWYAPVWSRKLCF